MTVGVLWRDLVRSYAEIAGAFMGQDDLKNKTELTAQEIMQLLPHRYPFLLVDRLVYTSEDRLNAIGYKGITLNEPCFVGHFPENPIFPGVLLIEAMAQAGGLMIIGSNPSVEVDGLMLVKIDQVRFRAPVLPGHLLEIHVKAVQSRGLTVKFEAKCMVDDNVMAEATLMAMGLLAEGQDVDLPSIKPMR